MDLLTIILGGSIGAGIMNIIQSCIQRKWQKDDKSDAIVYGLKVLLVDRVKHLVNCHINEGHISLSDKENLKDMHKAYKALGGNGHLDTAMKELDKIDVCGD